MDDEVIVTVTSPAGQQQVVKLNENDASGKPIGEQWVLSNVVNFESGSNQIKVDVVNVFAPSGPNASSSSIYIVVVAPSQELATGGSVPMNFDFWIKVNTGQWEETAEGIKVWGAGFRFGHQGVQSRDTFNFIDSETFIKWKSNGDSGTVAQFGVYLMGDYDIETDGYSA